MTTADAASHPATGPERKQAMSASLARNWWAVLLRGLAAIVFGAVALFLPGVTLTSLVLVFAAYMLVDGILAIVAGVKAAQKHERWGLLILEGVADLLASAAAFVLPGAALLVFVWILAAWAVISGALMLGAALRLHREHGRAWLIVGGVASVIWGALLLFFPIAGLIVMTWWLGAYAFVFGFSLLVLAFTLRRQQVAGAPGAAQAARR